MAKVGKSTSHIDPVPLKSPYYLQTITTYKYIIYILIYNIHINIYRYLYTDWSFNRSSTEASLDKLFAPVQCRSWVDEKSVGSWHQNWVPSRCGEKRGNSDLFIAIFMHMMGVDLFPQAFWGIFLGCLEICPKWLIFPANGAHFKEIQRFNAL